MLYQNKKQFDAIPPAINLQLLLALAGSLLTAGQILFAAIRGDILCLNEGCEIVEGLTTIPPTLFNLAGLFFFLIVFWTLWRGRAGARRWLDWARLLLLAGLAAEGVLVGFQYFVAEAFCSYCLVILGLIVLLNLLMGLRQIMVGTGCFAAVMLAFCSLEFYTVNEAGAVALAEGSYASLDGPDTTTQRYLFFSSNCTYCEEVIATIDDSFGCRLNFNPTDEPERFDLEQAVVADSYQPEVNRRFLRRLGIDTIPALVVETPKELRVLQGRDRIIAYLDGNCRQGELETPSQSEDGASMSSSSQSSYQEFLPTPQEDGCGVEEECPEAENFSEKESQ